MEERITFIQNSKEPMGFVSVGHTNKKRLFSLFSHQILRVGHENFDTTKIEGGFSFYETGYNETQPWFILKAKNTNSLFKKIEYTPTLRLINKAIFMDAGITDGDPSLHLMYTF